MKNVIMTILVMLVLGLGGYLVYDKVLVKEEVKDCSQENIEIVEEKVYTYKEIAGNYYYEQDANVAEMPGLMDRFGLILSEDGTFSYTHNRSVSTGVIGNYIINGNVITLNYIGSTNNGEGIEIIDKTHTLIINENKSITDESVDLGSVITSKISLSKEGVPSFFTEKFYSFDKILQEQIQLSQM